MNPMKQLILALFAAACLLASCDAPADVPQVNTTDSVSTAGLKNGKYVINKVKPKVTWEASKLTGNGHKGTLHVESGSFNVVDGEIIKGKVLFDMTRIAVTDLTGEDKASLEGHLRSGDFFNVDVHPQSALLVKGVSKENGKTFLNSTLLLNGITEDYMIPVELVEAELPGSKGLAIQGGFELDRTKHGIIYHSQTFDDKLDWFIKDEVSVGFSVIGVPVAM